MEYSKVLAAVTGDASDEEVVSQAERLLRSERGRLLILYVIKMDRSLPVDAEVTAEVLRGEAVLQRCEEGTRLPKGLVEAELLQAREVGPAVVHEAAVRDVDAVVLGTSYPTAFGAFSLGADIPYVLEHAPCHVVFIREPRPGARPSGAGGRNGRAGVRVD